MFHAATFWIRPALAMCAAPSAGMIPADGAADVPLDVIVVWTTTTWDRDEGLIPAIADAEGAPVSASLSWVDTGSHETYAMLVPDALLAADAAYVVTDGVTGGGFRTGSGTSTPPDPVAVGSVEADLSTAVTETCDGSSVWTEDADWARATVLAETPVAGWIEARVTDPDGGEHFAIGGDAGVTLSEGGCHRSNVEHLREWESFDVAIRAVNPAGAAGEWSQPEHVVLPREDGPECEEETGACGVPVGAGGWFVLAGLVGVVSRRRR